MEGQTRTETDAIGAREVPADAYYGIHTLRSVENFPISGMTASSDLIRAIALIKKAAALSLLELKVLDEPRARAIAQAAGEVADGRFSDQFPVDVFQMGAGTSTHMNVNEVLANRAIEILGGVKGDYGRVHPNDHVNKGQSTNDVFPTAMRVAARSRMGELLPALDALADAFLDRGRAFDGTVKAARTHLQDAVPIMLGQEFRAYGAALRASRDGVERACRALESLGIGGSAVGTGLNVHPGFRDRVVSFLASWYGVAFRAAPDLVEATQSSLSIAQASSALRLVALELIRICNDLRLLASGPTTGFDEIRLPATQPGSSIMPGKVNPSVPEMVNMVCFQVVGNDLAVAMAVQAGQLDLNVMMPVMAHNLLQSIRILTSAATALAGGCVGGIEANAERCRAYAERSVSLAAALNPLVGYARAADVVKEAVKTGKTIPEVVRERGLLTDDQIAEFLDVRKMTGA